MAAWVNDGTGACMAAWLHACPHGWCREWWGGAESSGVLHVHAVRNLVAAQRTTAGAHFHLMEFQIMADNIEIIKII